MAGSLFIKGGRSSRQRADAPGQRGAKAQPFGRSQSGGTVPVISASRSGAASARPRARDRAHQAHRVGMERVVEEIVDASLLDPAAGIHHDDRSATSATTPRSWVIRICAVPSRFCRSEIRPRICACTVTSSAVVGSSAMMIFGSQASASAIIARCRMPPESSCGNCAGAALGVRHLHQVQRFDGSRKGLAPARLAVLAHRFGDLFADGQDRVERRQRLLEDHGDLIAAQILHLALVHGEKILAMDLDRASCDTPLRVEAAERQRGHRFAAAGFADDAERFAGVDRKAMSETTGKEP